MNGNDGQGRRCVVGPQLHIFLFDQGREDTSCNTQTQVRTFARFRTMFLLGLGGSNISHIEGEGDAKPIGSNGGTRYGGLPLSLSLKVNRLSSAPGEAKASVHQPGRFLCQRFSRLGIGWRYIPKKRS